MFSGVLRTRSVARRWALRCVVLRLGVHSGKQNLVGPAADPGEEEEARVGGILRGVIGSRELAESPRTVQLLSLRAACSRRLQAATPHEPGIPVEGSAQYVKKYVSGRETTHLSIGN